MRHFYRCPDCLTISAADHEGYQPLKGLACELCARAVAHMGFVDRIHPDIVKRRGYVCPCDERCTGARGPNCECSCGGENHGSNAVVSIDTVTGNAPILRVKDKATAQRIAEEWRAALGQVQAEYDRTITGSWVPESMYARRCELWRAMAKAKSLKTHKARMAVLRPFCGVEVVEPGSLFQAV